MNDQERFQQELHKLWITITEVLHIPQLAAWVSRKLDR